MTHEEMSNFSHEELSALSHYELSLDKMKLLYKILANENNVVPEVTLKKLYSICTKTISELEESSEIKTPQKIKDIISDSKPSQKELSWVIKFIIKILVGTLFASGIRSVSADNINIDFSKESVKTIYYISNGDLDNDAASIIEEIKTTTNININLDEVKIDWNSEE